MIPRNARIELNQIAEISPVESLTRRELMAGAFAAALLVGQSDSEDDGETPSPDQREIQDAFGTVQLPANPERVVAVRHHHIGNMLALGVTPIGIVADASEFPFPGHAEALAGVTNVRAETDWMLDIEKALALDPDVILEMSGQEGEPWNQETCDLAKNVAPTACFPYGYTTEDEIKQNMVDVGVVLGREDEAAEIIAAYDARVAELQPTIAEARMSDRPIAHVIWQGNGNFFVPVDRPSNMILRGLGIPQLAFQADPSAGEVALSFENVEQLNEAYAVIVLLEGAGTREELEASPVWRLIEPAKNGRTLFLDGKLWGWDYLPALMHMLDDVEQKLLPLVTV